MATPAAGAREDGGEEIPLLEEAMLACQFASWYPMYRRHTIKSVIIPLPEPFITWLASDGVRLPTATDVRPGDPRALGHTATDAVEWSDDDEDEEEEEAEAAAGELHAAADAQEVAAELLQVVEAIEAVTDADGASKAALVLTPPAADVAPDYYLVVKKPIGLSHVRAKLMAAITGTEAYGRKQFDEDMALLWGNARLYSPPGSAVATMVDELQAVATAALADVDAAAAEDAAAAAAAEAAPPSFPELEAEMQAAIDKLGGAVFPKLNWSAPVDTKWVHGSLKCTTVGDVLLLLKSSAMLEHDLELAFERCIDTERTRPEQFTLVLRKWSALRPSGIFRAFVKQRTLLAVSQRDCSNYYAFLKSARMEIMDVIDGFLIDHVLSTFPLTDFVVDVYVDREYEVYVIDFGVFSQATDPLLFSWPELVGDIASKRGVGGEAEKKEGEAADGAAADGSAGAAAVEAAAPAAVSVLIDPEDDFELRIVESEVAMMPSVDMYYQMPKDLLDLTRDGSGLDDALAKLSDLGLGSDSTAGGGGAGSGSGDGEAGGGGVGGSEIEVDAEDE
eukprot:PLAT11342.1.p1 GENE.PLAT11342.1~~PLAT11342.1.p1  ORF type:complete len:562 (-),score=241.02 PLAT11342.1:1426-3111(-)